MLNYFAIPCVIQTELAVKTLIWTIILLFSTNVLQYLAAFSAKYSSMSILAVLMRGIKCVPVVLQFEITKILDKITDTLAAKLKEKKEKRILLLHTEEFYDLFFWGNSLLNNPLL